MESLKKLQEKRCKGCFFAIPEKVGTGQPCCTYPGIPHVEGDKCLTRREEDKNEQAPES